MPNSYPPVFSQNAVASAIAQINDFAGTQNQQQQLRNAVANNPEAQRAFASLGALGEGVPVVITGSRPPSHAHFPGLHETMIGAAIFQLAEQISPDNPLRGQIQELALQLHYLGGDKIARQRKARKGGKSQKA